MPSQLSGFDSRISREPFGKGPALAQVRAAAEKVVVVENDHRAILDQVGDEIEGQNGRFIIVTIDIDDTRLGQVMSPLGLRC